VKKSFSRSFPFLVSGILVLVALAGWWGVNRGLELFQRTRFLNMADEIEVDIRFRMQTYINVLMQTSAMLEVYPQLSRSDFQRFISKLEIDQLYPGIQGVGFTQRVEATQLATHLQSIRAQGFKEYKVWPLIDGETDHFPIVLLEPFDWVNRRAFGYDMFTEPKRRMAMQRAWTSGLPSATPPVRLVQETEKGPKPGFLIYVPVYGQDPLTPDQRLQQLRGFVYAPFRAKDLFLGIFPWNQRVLPVNFAVFVGEHLTAENQIFEYHSNSEQDQPPRFMHTSHFEIAGQPWTLVTTSAPALLQGFSQWIPPLTLGAGLLIAMLTFWLLYNYQWNIRSELQQKVLLQEAIKARDQFLSIASHELKTPLTSLKLQLQMARRKWKELVEQDPRLMKVFTTSLAQVDRLTSLVEDLLDVSRIKTGKMSLKTSPFMLHELLSEMADRVKEDLEHASIDLTLSVPEDLQVTWDESRMEQVLLNFVTNAIKYAPASSLSFAVTSRGDQVVVEVRDDGPGIPADKIHRIFERFERAEAPRNISGLGLGLFIVQQIVSLHGGSIKVESKVGEGTTFVMEIPKVVETAAV
jgi:signal transduction histidine kinase